MKIFSEWFGSKRQADSAASSMQKKGYTTKVRYAMDADGNHDWLMEVFA